MLIPLFLITNIDLPLHPKEDDMPTKTTAPTPYSPPVTKPDGLRTEKMSRRFFGQMLGMPTLLASTITVSACGGGDSTPAPSADSGDHFRLL
jgi:hypothetical protein